MFYDHVTITVAAGSGGAGVVAFRREKYVPFGGPAGGDGGKGGDVLLVVNPRLNTLSRFQRKRTFKAQSGHSGGNFNRTGASGEDLVLEVPPGTIVRNLPSSSMLADLTEAGQKFKVANGGRGGHGNARFKSSTHQSPRIAERGEPGQTLTIQLELKLIADVGIVGVPNSGKSTLLSVLTNAKPKIGDYPFTSTIPTIGTLHFQDRDIVVADIPGLIEGAHNGAGLGIEFLKHIQRTRVIIHLLDASSFDPLGDYHKINRELAEFDSDLLLKPQIVVVNKSDVPGSHEVFERLAAALAPAKLVLISAMTHMGLNTLMKHVIATVNSVPAVLPSPSPIVVSPAAVTAAFNVHREGNAYRVTGGEIERAAAMTYWEYDEAVERFQRILRSTGITEELRRLGVKKGDTVLIGSAELEWAE